MRKRTVLYMALAFSLLLLVSVSCSSSSYQTRDRSHGRTDVLNYSYTNEYFKKSVQKDHFQLSVTVDSPAIVNFGSPSFNPVHVRSGAGGSAVVSILVTPDGRVTSLEFVKRAGAGMDEYIEEIIRKSTFEPVVFKGQDQNSRFIVNVVIKDM